MSVTIERDRQADHADGGRKAELAIDETLAIELDDEGIGGADRATLGHQPDQVEAPQRPDRDEEREESNRRLDRRPHDAP